MNFLSNALKFTDVGKKVVVKIILLDVQMFKTQSVIAEVNSENSSLSEKAPENNIKTFLNYAIEIEDEGVGISKENIPKLFIDFAKLEEHEKINTNGTGLGLSICKLIIEKMRGRIDV